MDPQSANWIQWWWHCCRRWTWCTTAMIRVIYINFNQFNVYPLPCWFSWRTVRLCLSSIEGGRASHPVWKQTLFHRHHSQPFSSKSLQADDDNLKNLRCCSSNAVLLICPLPPMFASGATHLPSCKSSIRTFSRHPNCRNCGWRLSIDHRVTPGPGALSRLYPAPARANPWCSKG